MDCLVKHDSRVEYGWVEHNGVIEHDVLTEKAGLVGHNGRVN